MNKLILVLLFVFLLENFPVLLNIPSREIDLCFKLNNL